MKIPIPLIVLAIDVLVAIPVYIHARRFGRRSPTFDALIVTVIPILGLVMYVSSIRLGLTPPPLDTDKTYPPEPPSGSLVAELTAEVRRLRAELEAARADLDRIAGRSPGE